jgi:hypothetical protein
VIHGGKLDRLSLNVKHFPHSRLKTVNEPTSVTSANAPREAKGRNGRIIPFYFMVLAQKLRNEQQIPSYSTFSTEYCRDSPIERQALPESDDGSLVLPSK